MAERCGVRLSIVQLLPSGNKVTQCPACSVIAHDGRALQITASEIRPSFTQIF